jgi:hypothetical protein
VPVPESWFKSALQMVEYDPQSGVFRWRVSRRGHAKAGDVAGTLTHAGYIAIKTGGKVVGAHRLAWYAVHRVVPVAELDHRNGNKADNRIANLREATRAQNAWNARSPKVGRAVKGASFDPRRGKWAAGAMLNGARKHIGYFSTEREAQAAYRAFVLKHRGEFAFEARA